MRLCRGRQWDIEVLKNATNVSDNVADLLSVRLQRLDQNTLNMLTIASALGYEFEFDLLHNIALSEGILVSKGSRKNLQRMLNEAISDRFIEKCGDDKYKHSHDQMQFWCFYELIGSTSDQEALHHRIGCASWSKIRSSGSTENDAIVYLAADHRNCGRAYVTCPEDTTHLRDLNILAGKRAMKKLGFHYASNWFQIAANLSDITTIWKTEYDLTVDLLAVTLKQSTSWDRSESASVYQRWLLNRRIFSRTDFVRTGP